MSPIQTIVRTLRRCLPSAGVLAALVFLVGVFSTPLEAQFRRGGGGSGRGFESRGGIGFSPRGRNWGWGYGYGWRYGWGFGGDYVYYPTWYAELAANDFVIWPPPKHSTAASVSAQIVYDAAGNPAGVIISHADGTREYVPVTS